MVDFRANHEWESLPPTSPPPEEACTRGKLFRRRAEEAAVRVLVVVRLRVNLIAGGSASSGLDMITWVDGLAYWPGILMRIVLCGADL
jgi:hypothetical protein